MPRIVVLSTCGTAREARKIANDLVQKRLAACVNILPVTSCYRWKGKMVNGREWLLVIKTGSKVFKQLTRRVLALHTYELPEIISVKVDAGFQPYLAWIDGELSRR